VYATFVTCGEKEAHDRLLTFTPGYDLPVLDIKIFDICYGFCLADMKMTVAIAV